MIMKNRTKFILFFIVLLFSLILNVNSCSAVTTTVNNEESLVNAINNASNGDVISLGADIILTRPLQITGKTLTINGNGHTVLRVAENWTPDGANGSLITAGLPGTKVILSNIKLTNAQKYGAQVYDGAYLVLDGVTVSSNGYGGVLVNAGTLEVKDVKLYRNGSTNNNGIEIAKGNGIYSESSKPILIMNGTLTSTEDANVIYLAVNDQLSSFEVRNTDTTTNKIFVNGKSIVLTDANGNILYSSNENPNIPLTGDVYVAPSATPTTPTEPQTPAPAPTPAPTTPATQTTGNANKTPKTGAETGLGLAISILVISTIGMVALNKKELV